jgi:hypothetical protein
MTNNTNDYTIENDYYKAIIPKPTSNYPSTSVAKGIIKFLYVKKADGSWSNNLVYEGFDPYGLGYLEGAGSASNGINRSSGLQNSAGMIITIVENSPTRIILRSTWSGNGADFSELWTFWAKKPYFESDGSITATSSYLTNQFQFAWMVNSTLPISWYGTDKDGSIRQYSIREMQPIHSPNVNTYPWLNWQFTGENVSLGIVFTDINNKFATVGETGDMPFEYQLDFDIGGGSQGNPTVNGYQRAASTVYYTANSASNTPIQTFANSKYSGSTTTTAQEPIYLAAATATDPFAQAAGVASALVNTPYFLIRQNVQSISGYAARPQYVTSIYGPLFKNQDTITTGVPDFMEQLQYSLNYSNDTQSYTYGTISSVVPTNTSSSSSLQNVAESSDGKLAYSTTFTTWNDSDKFQITGTASNGSASAPVKSIYASITNPYQSNNYYEAESGTPTNAITTNLTATDSLWTNYDYPYDSGTTLIYRDNNETVPSLTIPVNVPDGQYEVVAYNAQRVEGAITYRYSVDNSVWQSFVVSAGASNTITPTSLGNQNISGGVFYIDDDNNAGSGAAGWAGWDKISIRPIVQSLGSNIYDFRLVDRIYGKMGVAVKVNSPTTNIVLSNNSALNVFMYSQASAQTLTTFSYPFDIEVYPHNGWLASTSDYTALHSKSTLSYSKHAFYPPLKLHTGRTNSVYTDGSITYSSDPNTSATEANMDATPSAGLLSVNLDTWTNGDSYKKWRESETDHSATTSHTISNLSPNTSYLISKNLTPWKSVTTDANGVLTFVYNEGFSEVTFELQQGNLPGTPTPTPTSGGAVPAAPSAERPPNCPSGYTYCVDAGPNQKHDSDFIKSDLSPGVEVFIGKDATKDDIHVNIIRPSLDTLMNQQPPVPFPWSQGLNTASEIYDVKALSAFNGYPILKLDNFGTIILPYSLDKIKKVSLSQLRIAWYDTTSRKWKIIKNNTVLNTQNNTVSNTTMQMSTYFVVVYQSPMSYSTGKKAVISSPAKKKTTSLPKK